MQFGKRTLSLLLALGLTTTSIPIALAADPGAAETPALAASANPEKTNSDYSQPEKAASKSESSQPSKAAPKAESPKQASAPKQETPSVSSASSSADTDVPKKQDTQQESAPKQEDPQQTDPGSEKPQQEQPAQEDPVSEDPQQQDPGNEDPQQQDPDSEDPEQEDPDSEDPEQEESQQEEEDPDAEQPLSDEDIQDQEARDQEESQAEEPLSDEDMREQEARDQKQAQAQAGKDQKKRKRKIFTNPSDRKIEKALEKYDSTIKDPEYEKAYTNYQEDLILDEAVEEGTPELFSTNPFTDDSFVHTHPKTKYIYKGIDVSKWQGTIDWKAARAAGVRFAFVRCGYSPRESGAAFGTYMDERFAENVVNAANAGVKVGVYYYSTASSVAEAKKEAAYIVKLLNPYKKLITLPAIMDYETNKDDRVWDTYRRTTRATRTKFAAAFCQTLSDAGYQSGIYASRSWLNNFFDMSKLNKYHHWPSGTTPPSTAVPMTSGSSPPPERWTASGPGWTAISGTPTR